MNKGTPGLPHEEAAAVFHARGRQGLEARLGYSFSDKDLLARALTHPSVIGAPSNQRLEFLGDAVLQLCVSRALFLRSGEAEGKLTFRRQRLVREDALAEVARALDLGSLLRLAPDFRKRGGAQQDSVLADAMEAVLGALYLDGGIEAAGQVVNALWADRMTNADAALDPKGALQALTAEKRLPEPAYRLLLAEGPPHSRRFTAAVSIAGEELARGEGRTIRAAQQQAAQQALGALNQREAGE